MQLENSKLGRIGLPPSKHLFVLLGLLALVVSLPVMARVSSAATGASVSLSYSVNGTGSQSYILVTITAKDSQFPNSVLISMTSSYNGASSAYNTQSITYTPGPGGSVSHSFNVPYKGTGNYVFTGSVANTKGTILVQATIDPLIEPEWK